MGKEDNILRKAGTGNPFRVPEHYFEDFTQELMSKLPDVQIVAQGEYVARSLQDYLHRHPEMDERCTKEGICRFLTTESEEKFKESASIFLRQDNISVERITLE